jgi:hypothetical protein
MTLEPGSGYEFPSSGKKKNKSKAPCATVLFWTECAEGLLDRDALSQIAGLIDIATERDGHVISEQLQRNHR